MATAAGESASSPVRPFSPKATVNITTWLLLIVSTVSVLIRLTIKHVSLKRLQLDDLLAILSVVTHVGSGAATTIASNNAAFNGGTLSDYQRRRFSQSLFASNLLFIATACFAKTSILTLFNIITERKIHRQAGLFLSILIILWASISCLALGITCKVPRPWNTVPACRREVNFWYIFESLNIATDCIIIGFTIFIVWPLKMSQSRKFIVLGCFGARIFDVAATIVQINFTKSFDDSIMSRNLWTWMLVTQLVQCITIITSCIPYMRPLLDALPSGMHMSDEIRRKDRVAGPTDSTYVRIADYGYVLKSTVSARDGSTRAGGASRSAGNSITSNV